MASPLLSLLVLPLLASGPVDDAAAVELRYTGTLSKAARAADETPVKRFNVYCLAVREPDGGRKVAFVLSERGAGGWPWPERFGSIALDSNFKQLSPGNPRLLYEYEGNPLVIPLPFPIPRLHGPPQRSGAKWTSGKETWEVGRTQKVQDRNCWQVDVSTNFGRKRTLAIDADSPVVVSLEERVFVGQGDEHVLHMQLESVKTLDADELAKTAAAQARPALLKLQC